MVVRLVRSVRPLLFLAVFFISALLLLSLFREPLRSPPEFGQCPEAPSPSAPLNCSYPANQFGSTTCLIDGKRRVPCVRQLDGREEVFLPFNAFLRRQFDLYGQFDKFGHFEYFTSEVKVRQPGGRAGDGLGPLDSFNNVAMRQRVKCLCPENGLPMSVQWEPTRTVPYFYPVQILQFGLEQYSKNRTLAGKMRRKWDLAKIVGRRKVGRIDGNLLSLEEGQTEQFQLLSSALPFLAFSWKPKSASASFELIFEDKTGQKLRMEFSHSRRKDCVWMEEREEPDALHFIYGLENVKESNANFSDMLLDMPVFMAKALALLGNSSGNGRAHQRLEQEFVPKLALFHGPLEMALDSLQQRNSAHEEMFFRVADWLLHSQDSKGGWAVPIQRTFDIDEGRHQLRLQPGWHSAMAQGHALSFLSRAFSASGDERFLEAGRKALDLFELPSSEGGVLNRLFGLDWFEEYPTQPHGTFVLNGFLYALIGLHDFSAHSNRSVVLLQRGLHSLQTLLPLYDTGQRSIYDLRHLQLGSRPNIARWDYHALHVSLLDWLHSATGGERPLLREMAQRWAEYARGLALKHN